MTALEPAIHEFQLIRDAAVRTAGWSSSQISSRQLTAWYRDTVVPAIHFIWELSAFRSAARWALDHLLQDADSPERRQIDEVRLGLYRYATLTVQFADSVPSCAFLSDLINPEFGPACGMFYGDSLFETLSRRRQSVERLARIGIPALVSKDDFLVSDPIVYDSNRSAIRLREFTTGENPDLKVADSPMIRCLFIRLELAIQKLRSFNQLLGNALSHANFPSAFEMTQIAAQRLACWRLLVAGIIDLRQRLLVDRLAQERNACATLAQVYLAFAANSNFSWLGIDAQQIEQSQDLFFRDIRSPEGTVTSIRIAKALRIVHEMFVSLGTPEQQLELVVARGGMVICVASERVFWEGKLIDVDWSDEPQLWRLLLKLCRKRPGFVALADVYGDREVTDGALRNLVARLRRQLPKELRQKLRSSTGNGYRIDLPCEQLRVINDI